MLCSARFDVVLDMETLLWKRHILFLRPVTSYISPFCTCPWRRGLSCANTPLLHALTQRQGTDSTIVNFMRFALKVYETALFWA